MPKLVMGSDGCARPVLSAEEKDIYKLKKRVIKLEKQVELLTKQLEALNTK